VPMMKIYERPYGSLSKGMSYEQAARIPKSPAHEGGTTTPKVAGRKGCRRGIGTARYRWS
jgi:hypothetical protein